MVQVEDKHTNTRENGEESVSNVAHDSPKYMAGKNPRHDNFPVVDYSKPLNPKSELFADSNWTIPQFNLFVSFTIDNLIDEYKYIFKDFIKLPSRKFHPQYYYKIEQPISINEIKSRNYEYPGGIKHFLLDIELLAKNCNSYNEDDSLIVKNGYQMVDYVKYELIKAKNIKRNYLVSNDIKTRLLKYLDTLTDSTERSIIRELNSGDKSGRNFKIAEPFLELVDKDELPEYYEVIHKPMALNVIKNNLEMDKYLKIYDVVIDILLTFHNALVFNDAGSPIYENANLILDYFNYLITTKFFPELKDASDRGEIVLQYDKIALHSYSDDINVDGTEVDSNNNHENDITSDGTTGNGANSHIGPNGNEDYDFNHFEGLGNGYARTLLPKEDYLLGTPSKNINTNDAHTNKKIKITTETIEKPLKSKYNIIKSLEKDFISEEHTIQNEPYKLINKISIFTSNNLYQQAMNPMPGSRPPVIQNWLEYNFNVKDLSQNENIYSFTVQPIQTFLTMIVKLNNSNYKNSLLVNSDVVQSTAVKNTPKASIQEGGMNVDASIASSNENDKKEQYEIRLIEGLNELEFKSETNTVIDNNSSASKIAEVESFKFWINVLP